MPREKRVFLTAEWRDLVMLNYEVNRAPLEENALGTLAIPFHANFDEVNLRFYLGSKGEAKTAE